MAKIFKSAAELIGNTPLLELQVSGSSARILAKLESWNPAGSVKDRIAVSIIDDAEVKGILQPGGTVIEPTSGNAGISVCSAAVARGYRCVIVMPDSTSRELQHLVRAYGGEVVLTPASEGMQGAIRKAEKLAEEIPNSFVAGQFVNPANPDAHYRTTGPEIYRDTDGKVDILVAGIGTGGTISGVGRYLKEQNPDTIIVGVEPAQSPVLTQGICGCHGIQGIGTGFIPDTLDRKYVDHIMTVSTEDAAQAVRRMTRQTGILVGISSGAALHAAMELTQNSDYAGKNVVVICPDSGQRHLSAALYEDN